MSSSLVTTRRSIYSEALVRRVLTLDGVVNVLGALALWAAAGTWASAFSMTTSLPIVVLGAAFLVNGIECIITARKDALSPAWLWGLATVDAIFAAVALLVAATDPSGADSWARWALAIVADATLITGAIKGYAAYRVTRAGRAS